VAVIPFRSFVAAETCHSITFGSAAGGPVERGVSDWRRATVKRHCCAQAWTDPPARP